jgi:large subunit ribosomal protein L13
MKIVVNGESAVYGRLCSYVAKRAMEGDEISVVNCEKVVITGNKVDIINRFRKIKEKGGHSMKGPILSKDCFKILKRGIRGMMSDHRKGMGKLAFRRIKCYNSIPEELKGQEMISLKGTKQDKYIELAELSRKL